MKLNPLGLLEVSPRHSLVVALIVTPLWLVFRVLLEPGAFNPLEVLVIFGLSFTSYRLGTTLSERLGPSGLNALVLAAAVGTLLFTFGIAFLGGALGLRLEPVTFFIDVLYWGPLLRAAFFPVARASECSVVSILEHDRLSC
jgi:hypothetical protein